MTLYVSDETNCDVHSFIVLCVGEYQEITANLDFHCTPMGRTDAENGIVLNLSWIVNPKCHARIPERATYTEGTDQGSWYDM